MIRRPPRSTLFPTRRSSDLSTDGAGHLPRGDEGADRPPVLPRDRKSTRLNSSHVAISYAVFCLKKKKQNAQARLCQSRIRTTAINDTTAYTSSAAEQRPSAM